MIRILAFALVLTLAACNRADAHGYKLGDLEVGHPWSRPAAKGMTGAGYLTVTNRGGKPDRLVAVETPVARTVEIHQSSTAGGVMRMRPLRRGVVVAPGRTVAFAPGGNHLMLIGLKRPLAVGDSVPATLVFERAGRLPVQLKVQRGAPEPRHKGH